MKTPPPPANAREVFEIWREEDREIETLLNQIRDWMIFAGELGVPRYSETINRLAWLRSCLSKHFDREDELCDQLTDFYTSPCPEIDAMRRQASHDRTLLLERVDALILDLDALEPPFESWQAAIDEVGLFLDTVEQHEDQESESIRALLPLAS